MRYVPVKRYKIGHYGMGTLWCLKNRYGIFVLFNSVRIARTGLPDSPQEGRWISLEPGWKVTSSGGPAILVQHGDSDGVLVSLLVRGRRTRTRQTMQKTEHCADLRTQPVGQRNIRPRRWRLADAFKEPRTPSTIRP